MIDVQARGVESTGGDYRFLGPPVHSWWYSHPAQRHIPWEQLAVLVDSDGHQWRAAVFGIDAHRDGIQRQTQFMLAFSGTSADGDHADLLLRLLHSVLADGGISASQALSAQFPIAEVEKLRMWSTLAPDGSVPDSARAAREESQTRAIRALQTLHQPHLSPWAGQNEIAVGAHTNDYGVEQFLSVVAALCSGTTGRAVTSAGVANLPAAREVVDELAHQPGISFVLAAAGAEPFDRYERTPVVQEIRQPKKAVPGQPGFDHSSAGSGGHCGGGDPGAPAEAPHARQDGSEGTITLWLGVEAQQHFLTVDFVGRSEIKLDFDRRSKPCSVHLAISKGGGKGRIEVTLQHEPSFVAEVSVIAEGSWLVSDFRREVQRIGDIHRVRLSIPRWFDWAGQGMPTRLTSIDSLVEAVQDLPSNITTEMKSWISRMDGS